MQLSSPSLAPDAVSAGVSPLPGLPAANGSAPVDPALFGSLLDDAAAPAPDASCATAPTSPAALTPAGASAASPADVSRPGTIGTARADSVLSRGVSRPDDIAADPAGPAAATSTDGATVAGSSDDDVATEGDERSGSAAWRRPAKPAGAAIDPAAAALIFAANVTPPAPMPVDALAAPVAEGAEEIDPPAVPLSPGPTDGSPLSLARDERASPPAAVSANPDEAQVSAASIAPAAPTAGEAVSHPTAAAARLASPAKAPRAETPVAARAIPVSNAPQPTPASIPASVDATAPVVSPNGGETIDVTDAFAPSSSARADGVELLSATVSIDVAADTAEATPPDRTAARVPSESAGGREPQPMLDARQSLGRTAWETPTLPSPSPALAASAAPTAEPSATAKPEKAPVALQFPDRTGGDTTTVAQPDAVAGETAAVTATNTAAGNAANTVASSPGEPLTPTRVHARAEIGRGGIAVTSPTSRSSLPANISSGPLSSDRQLNARAVAEEKNPLSIVSKPDRMMGKGVGTNVAQAGDPMSSAPAALHPTADSASPGAASMSSPPAHTAAVADSQPAAPAPSLPHAAEAARRTIETVLTGADRFADASRAVNLRFSVSGVDLAVHVALRGDAIHTTFRTDSPELRTALADQWREVTGDDRSHRLADPVFTPGRGEASPGGGNGSPSRDSSARQGAWTGAAENSARLAARAASPRASAAPAAPAATVRPATPRLLHAFA